MNVEIWDLYDAQGEKTGKTMIRGEAIPVGFYHIGVHIWPMNDKGELLIQRRPWAFMEAGHLGCNGRLGSQRRRTVDRRET